MKYLTIDTTTKVTALALAEDGVLVGEGFLHTKKTHSERLVPMLDQLLNAADWNLKDLDFLGVVRGPGSFTGIRIGIATAQGLALVLNLPQVGVLSLDALSWAGYGREEDIVVILDARKNEWYSAGYRWKNHGSSLNERECLFKPCAIKPEVLCNFLKENNKVIFAGDAVKGAEQYLHDELGDKAIILPHYQCLSRGAYAVCEVWKKVQAEGIVQNKSIEPYYIRVSEAEVNYLKKQAKIKNL